MKFLYSIIKSLLFFTLAMFVLCVIGLFTTIHLLFDEQPSLLQYEKASLADIQRIKKVAIEVSGQLQQQGTQQLILSERDINLGISHFGPALLRLPKNGYARVAITEQQQAVEITLPADYVSDQFYRQFKNQLNDHQLTAFNFLQNWTSEKWVNLQLEITVNPSAKSGQWIQPSRIRLGSIQLSQSISKDITDVILTEALAQPAAKPALLAWGNIKGIQHQGNDITIDYVLPQQGETALSNYESLLFSPDEQQLIAIYEKQLLQLPKQGQLVSLLAPLFEFALSRSQTSKDPVAENRAALLALAKSFGGDELTTMLSPATIANFQANAKPYTIYGRRDLALHMALSAGLTLVADEGLAELIGLDKEISDLMGGKTISAWDLLADKAGVRLAQNATRSAKSARQLQIKLSKARRDNHILPDLGADFSYSGDRFSTEDIEELTLLIELYLEELDILKP
ncbi:MAG: hypothetical protein HOH29_09450 [Cellvibrionales bacterium]|jgi:hypothetical protein|nr:hypothetical protein [Cellvibrionales bacterium]